MPSPQQGGNGTGKRLAIFLGTVLGLTALIGGAGLALGGGKGLPGAAPGGTSAPPAGGNDPAPVTDGAPPELMKYYSQRLDWQACGDTQQCATLRVPVDYTKPDGEEWKIALRRAPATDKANRIGSLIVNPGGPGGSGVDYVTLADLTWTSDLRSRFDIVGFDPRGIGKSEAPKCLTNKTMDGFFNADPTADTPAEKAALDKQVKDSVAECVAKGAKDAAGRPNRVLFMSTTNVAKDMDILRAVLGDKQLNYHGVSYGTVLGAIYADLFPKHAGRLVLDSAVSPKQTDDQELTYDAQGFSSSIDAYIDHCVQQSDCPLGTDAKAARAKLLTFLKDVDKKPLAVSDPKSPPASAGWVGFTIFMSLYTQEAWPMLDDALKEAMSPARKGDKFLSLAYLFIEREPDGTYKDSTYLQAMIPVRCADWPKGKETPGVREKLYKADPLFAEMQGTPVESCQGWPGPVRTVPSGTMGNGAAPILVIGNTKDPATPIGGTKQLAGDLASGVLVTAENAGHGAYNSGNDCATKVVDEYLINGRLPKNGHVCS